MSKFGLVLTGLALAGCASGGSGGSGGANSSGTMFNSPKQVSKEEFTKDPKSYAKSWVIYKGGGVDSFKKITIPTYTLEVNTSMYKVGKNKVAGFFKGDGNRSTLTLAVNFPWEKHQAMFQEVAGLSYARLTEKFKKIGVEVVPWSSVVSTNEEAAEYNKESLGTEPIVKNETMVSFTAPGASRVTKWSPYALSSLSRDAKVALFFPNFGMGYGYFDGEATPFTITEAHGVAAVNFTPQVQVLSGSGFSYQSKWDAGVMNLDHTAVSNDPFVNKLVKDGDSRADAKSDEESRRALVMGLSGAKSHEVAVSSAAGVQYTLDVNAEKLKASLLAQLDAAENLVVERYKNEL